MRPNPKVLRLLLARGAANYKLTFSVDVTNPRNGFTAFHYACYYNQVRETPSWPSSWANFSLL
jgi:hypothetical protein